MKLLTTMAIILAAMCAAPAMADREYSYNKSDSFDGNKVESIKIDVNVLQP